MASTKVTLDEIIGLQRYEEGRQEFRQRIIDLKRCRRLTVGACVTFVFENHDTMWFQIQEMLRAEQIVDLDKVREEVDVYNELVPAPGELSATMLIEITDSESIRTELLRFIGVEDCVYLEVGDHRVDGEFEGGRSQDDKISAVQYVRFKLDDTTLTAFKDDTQPVRLVIDHANYRHAATFPSALRDSLTLDLG